MCGICGELGPQASVGRVTKATRAMRHRGPDDEAVVRSGRAVLGHRRLSIIDLSEAGRQPMSNEDGTVWLVFNGEIYNFQELRELLEPHHRFASRSDSEVLVHGFEEWGITGLLGRIRGMFAFAVWDRHTETLYLARDHIGKKPVFYSNRIGRFAFASTLPALLELLEVTPAVSTRAIADYLQLKYVPPPETIFEGVHQLPPASYLVFEPGSAPHVTRYWVPTFEPKVPLNEAEWIDKLGDELRRAVRQRLFADVPVGVFLSGGVDSSIIAALMAEVSGVPPVAFSMAFAQPELDESRHARAVSAHLGCEHLECRLDSRMLNELPEMVWHFGQPFSDAAAVPIFHLSRTARERVKVILTGDGGDEAFAGYPSVPAAALARYARIVPGVRSGLVADLLGHGAAPHSKATRGLRWIAEFARGRDGEYGPDPLGRGNFRVHAGVLGPALGGALSDSSWARQYKEKWREAAGLSWADRAMYTDLTTLLPNDFLAKSDAMTMAHSVEARSPFLDVGLLELSARIPWKTKLRMLRTKHLLKVFGERILPRGVLYRPKQGLIVPTGDWMRNGLRPLTCGLLLSQHSRRRGFVDTDRVGRLIAEHERGIVEHGQRLWSLLNLELWCRMFLDRDIPRTATLSDIAGSVPKGAPK